MSKRRGLSVDDKRTVIMKLYHDYKEPFNLKEVETKASKNGVVLQTVKDMNQSLVDDFMVYSDKIGAANFFWAFPSKLSVDKSNERDKLISNIARYEESFQKAKSDLEFAKQTRNEVGRKEKVIIHTS